MSRRHDERGAGTLLIGIVMMVLVMATIVAIWITGWLGSARRADDAADLTALTGAQAYGSGADACSASRAAATANGARVEQCSVEGGSYSWVVRVTVSVPLKPGIVGAPRRIARDAVAGSA